MSTHRQRKAAETRIGLMEAFFARLDDRTVDEIPVKELCDAVGVSQATFFNYFADKRALFLLFLQLWSIEMHGVVAAHDPDDPLGAIEAVFLATAATSDPHPNVLAEITAYQARHQAPACLEPLTDAEIERAFPGRPELLRVPRDAGLDHLIPPLVQRAIACGQLPPGTDPLGVLMGVATIFFGVAVLRRQVPHLPAHVAYGQQLRWLWAALRASPPPG